ncbi:MMPL family transporter [Mesonia sp. MT50]|uniref:MMPL family transporter n=1 Tax=Mesonia profundi TaxID=3070998 RepID=A0ABU1A0S1_9FLAO|nr:MMPL family transporter [Mesonia profundi]MDQ7917299.1 MMPL family transporter [Mesonia profundi]
MSNFLTHIYQFFKRQPWLLWLGVLCLLAISLFSITKMEFKEDITQLIPKNDQSLITQKVLNTVDFTDKIIVNIGVDGEAKEEKLVAYAEEFLGSLQDATAFDISKIQGKVADAEMLQTYDFIYENLPLFLEEKDYKTIEKKLLQDSIRATLNSSYKSLLSPAGIITKKYIVKDPLNLTALGLEKLKRLQIGDDFDIYKGYLLTNNRKNILLFITPNFTAANSAKSEILSKNLYKVTQKLNATHDEVSASLFGSMLYAAANAQQIKQDIQYTIGFALVLLLVILISFYRKLYIPIILFIPTLIGGTLAIGILGMFKTEISLISLGIGSILLGITLDYALHILTHAREHGSTKSLYKEISSSILMSSATTATAFFCLLFVKSEALNDLGVFAAISVLISAIAALVIIPQLYQPKVKENLKSNWLDQFSAISLENNKWLVGVVLAFFVVGLFFFQKVDFDDDLSSLNFQPQELVKAEQRLEETTQSSAASLYVVSYGEGIDEALQTNHSLFKKLETLESNHEIKHFSSLGGIVISEEDQQQKINAWKNFWNAERKDSLTENLKAQGKEVGFKTSTFNKFYTAVNKDFKTIYLNKYKKVSNLFLDEFLTDSEKEKWSTVVSIVQVTDAQQEEFRNFIDQEKNVLSIDKKALNESLLGSLQSDFSQLISYSFMAIFLILWFSFRKIELVIITLLPIGITWVIALFCMYLLGIQFNILNIIISTFIFGLGIDYSIFITHGLRQEYEETKAKLTTYRSSIVLSVITTLLGMGVLIFAKHPALTSIATVSIIGVLTAALVSFTIQPWLFRLAINYRTQNGLTPLQWRSFLMAVLSFVYFGVGAFLVSVLSVLLIPILPFRKEKKMLAFHKVVASLMSSVLGSNPFVEKKQLQFSDEIWKQPSILIANHSSFLDILSLGKLHPKMVFLVNDWVYNSPVFGKAVRLAGFFPVSNGIDDGVEHLQQKVEEGYSLIAFPEGSRSFNNKMKRFHKGAFYLAEKLNIPITPILIHGNSEVLPKGDFVIHDGKITLKCLPQIQPDSQEFGIGYRARTKNISAYFRKEYQELKDQIEQENYFRKYLLSNYRYTSYFTEINKEYKTHIEAHLKISQYLKDEKTVNIIDSSYGMWSFYHQIRRPFLKVNALFLEEADKNIATTRFSAKHLHLNLSELTEAAVNKSVHLIVDRKNLRELTNLNITQVDNIYVVGAEETKDFPELNRFTNQKKEEGLLILRRENASDEE